MILKGNLLRQLTGTSSALTPWAKDGPLYLGAGYHYGPLYAIRPGASGDITLDPTETNNEWSWRADRFRTGVLYNRDSYFAISGVLSPLAP